jgi:transposase
MTSKEDHIEWRRAKVLELSSQGFSKREIATRLHVSKTTIHVDLVDLRKEAKESLQHHIAEVIPEEYQRCMTVLENEEIAEKIRAILSQR